MNTRSHTIVRAHCTVLLVVAAALCSPVATDAAAGGASGVQLVQGSPAATLVGTWRVEVTLRHCETGAQQGEPFPALATFADGGTVTTSDGGMSPAARGAGHGVWWRLTGRTFAAVTEAFLFGPTGALTGRQRLAQEIQVAGDGRSFHASVFARVTSTAGQVLFTGCATSTGRRLD